MFVIISVFSVENVSHKVQLKGDVRGQATQNVGDLVLVLQGMKVNMANFPAKNGTHCYATVDWKISS